MTYRESVLIARNLIKTHSHLVLLYIVITVLEYLDLEYRVLGLDKIISFLDQSVETLKGTKNGQKDKHISSGVSVTTEFRKSASDNPSAIGLSESED
jgi:hypothetical protein